MEKRTKTKENGNEGGEDSGKKGGKEIKNEKTNIIFLRAKQRTLNVLSSFFGYILVTFINKRTILCEFYV